MRLVKWLDEHFEEYVLAALLVSIACVMLLQVVARYLLNSSLSWPEELSRYCFIWSAFLSVGLSIKTGSMLRIDLAVNLLPKALKNAAEVMVRLATVVFFAHLLLNSFAVVGVAYHSGQVSPAVRVPMYLMYCSTVVGFSLALVRSVQSTVALVRGLVPVKSGGGQCRIGG